MTARAVAIFASASLAAGLAAGAMAQSSACQADINRDGVVDGIDLAYVIGNWGVVCPLSVEAVTPAVGPKEGGTEVIISGARLDNVTTVLFGGVPATGVVVISPTAVRAITPSSSQALPVDVTVTAGGETATLRDGFSYQLAWATVIEFEPDPKVVTDESLREAIASTGLPWRVRANASQSEMLLVPAGSFMMGCSGFKPFSCSGNEFPIHAVTLSSPFYLQRYEVTQAEWAATMGGDAPDPAHAKNFISYIDAGAFASATGLRFPTEAEWEFACRAGTDSALNNGSNDPATLETLAWFADNSDDHPHPVGQKLPNALGFHDMHGNVAEWVADWFGPNYYAVSPIIDPPGPATGTLRTYRGGGFDYSAYNCRVSMRFDTLPTNGGASVGVRFARNP